ncbi:hypothetical protein [Occallatibacter savannae]|uniref:hypothetical protein n=1 Tax=Occallatibacter savannae TaxID=1002691 RepID=UPI000D68814A|nr:hypothetical protein [Occallatibacter savannae]
MQDHPAFTSHRSKVAEDILCATSYLTPLPAAVMLIIPGTRRNRRIRFHACQSALLNWLLLSAGFLLHLRANLDQLLDAGTGSRFEWTARILCMAVWSIVALRVAGGRELRIPVLSRFAEQQANSWLFRLGTSSRGEERFTANPRLKEAIQLYN